MSMQVSEKEIEIERLKTTVFALNGKCELIDDHVNDVKASQAKFDDSERQRAALQSHITETSQKLLVDSDAHKKYQSDLLAQIKAL